MSDYWLANFKDAVSIYDLITPVRLSVCLSVCSRVTIEKILMTFYNIFVAIMERGFYLQIIVNAL